MDVHSNSRANRADPQEPETQSPTATQTVDLQRASSSNISAQDETEVPETQQFDDPHRVSKSGVINAKDAVPLKSKKRKDIPGPEIRDSKKPKILEDVSYSYPTQEVDPGTENGSDLGGRVSALEEDVTDLKWEVDSLKDELKRAREAIVKLLQLDTGYRALRNRVIWLEEAREKSEPE